MEKKNKKTNWLKKLTFKTWAKAAWHRVLYVKDCLLVFLGYRTWAKQVRTAPKYQRCPKHGSQMKRKRKLDFGAVYECRQCKRGYVVEGGALKLIPVQHKKEVKHA